MTDTILLDDQWVVADASSTFQASDPATGQPLPERYPVSRWSDLDRMLDVAVRASGELRELSPTIPARFLELFADALEQDATGICELAALETGLPFAPRLKDVELPRTIQQLRQAAAAARDGSWALPTIDSRLNIRSWMAPLGPVWCIGPNNFPLAYNGICGGDFAAAIGAGNPVIAKAHPCHPGTTQRIAGLALTASRQSGLPQGTIQMFYRCESADGLRMAGDPRLGGIGFTGGRTAGTALKQAADAVGKPVYLEMSSINPVVILPGALQERAEEIVGQFCTSCLMAAGQFCTNPGFVLVPAGAAGDAFVAAVAEKFSASPAGTLLSTVVRDSLLANIGRLTAAGAELLAGGRSAGAGRFAVENTLLRITARQFLADPVLFQTELFGAASLMVVAEGIDQMEEVLGHLEGNLTGSIYWSRQGQDDDACAAVTRILRPRVGRLLHDKMPTGVAVTAAMNHGGPFPATGHPGFTAVGFPATLRRFSALHCYDGVREAVLPAALRDRNPNGQMLRLVDGSWTRDDVPPAA